MFKLYSIVILLFGITSFATTGGSAADTIKVLTKLKVGIVLNPDGKYFLVQRPIYRGIKLFFEGKLNLDIELISADDSLEGQRKAAKETVERGLQYVIGHNFSGLAEAYLRSLPAHYGLSYFTPFATSTNLTSIRPRVHIVWPSNDRQIDALLSFVRKEKISTDKIVVIVNESETYSVDMADIFQYKTKNLKVALDRVSYIRDNFRPRELADLVIERKPTLLFVPIYNRDLIDLYQAIVEKLPDKSIFPAIIAGDTVGSESDFYKMISPQTEIPASKFFFTNGFSDVFLKTILKDFASVYEKRFGEAANGAALAGYHAAQLLYDDILYNPLPSGIRSINVLGWKGYFDIKSQFVRPLVVNEITAKGFKLREVIHE